MPVLKVIAFVQMFLALRSRTSSFAGYLQISAKDHPDPFGFLLDDGQLAVLQLIAEGEGTMLGDRDEGDVMGIEQRVRR